VAVPVVRWNRRGPDTAALCMAVSVCVLRSFRQIQERKAKRRRPSRERKDACSDSDTQQAGIKDRRKAAGKFAAIEVSMNVARGLQ